jgi:hypothetical protein
MDDTTLRALLDGATESEPPTDRPIGRIIADSRQAGGRLRRRRLVGSTAAAVASVAVLTAAASLASGAAGAHNPQSDGGMSGQMAYVLTSQGAVVPVNLATMTAGRPLQTGLTGVGVSGIVAARGGRTVYVSTRGGVIVPISTATGRVGRDIRVAGNGIADPLVSTPNGEVSYAMYGGLGYSKASAKLTPIDLMTGTKLRQMSMPFSYMNQAAVSLNSRTLLLAGAGSGGSATTVVSLVNVASERAQKPISFNFGDPNGAVTCVAVSPDGGIGYMAVTNGKPGIVVPIDVSADWPLKAIKLPSLRYSNTSPPDCSMAVAPSGRTAYVLIQRYVVPIDLVTGRALKPVELPVSSANDEELGIYGELSIDPDGKMAYALDQQGVTPIDLATNTALPTISLGHQRRDCFTPRNPFTQAPLPRRCYTTTVGGWTSLSFSPNGTTALVGVTGPHSNSLLPIQAETGKAGKAIPLPGEPVSVVVTP